MWRTSFVATSPARPWPSGPPTCRCSLVDRRRRLPRRRRRGQLVSVHFKSANGTVTATASASRRSSEGFQPGPSQVKSSGATAMFAFYAGARAVDFVKQYKRRSSRPASSSSHPAALPRAVSSAAGRRRPGHLHRDELLARPGQRGQPHVHRRLSEGLRRPSHRPTRWPPTTPPPCWTRRSATPPSPDLRRALNAAIGKLGQIDSPRGPWQFDARTGPRCSVGTCGRSAMDGAPLSNGLTGRADHTGLGRGGMRAGSCGRAPGGLWAGSTRTGGLAQDVIPLLNVGRQCDQPRAAAAAPSAAPSTDAAPVGVTATPDAAVVTDLVARHPGPSWPARACGKPCPSRRLHPPRRLPRHRPPRRLMLDLALEAASPQGRAAGAPVIAGRFAAGGVPPRRAAAVRCAAPLRSSAAAEPRDLADPCSTSLGPPSRFSATGRRRSASRLSACPIVAWPASAQHPLQCPLPTHTSSARATDDDQPALQALAELDSQRPLDGPALVGSIDGRPATAISLQDRRVIADPFLFTVQLRQVLRMRAAALHAREQTPSLPVRVRAAIGTVPAARATELERRSPMFPTVPNVPGGPSRSESVRRHQPLGSGRLRLTLGLLSARGAAAAASHGLAVAEAADAAGLGPGWQKRPHRGRPQGGADVGRPGKTGRRPGGNLTSTEWAVRQRLARDLQDATHPRAGDVARQPGGVDHEVGQVARRLHARVHVHGAAGVARRRRS